MSHRISIPVSLALLAVSVAGCHPTKEEYQAQLDKYAKLESDSATMKKRLSNELDEANERINALEEDLKSKGFDVTKLRADLDKNRSTLAEQEKALAEYKARAAQLERIKQRFEMLKKKLDSLTKLGLAVNIRRSRMVISLPGDVLFDSGKDTLKKEGLEILSKVSGIIKADATLLGRDYQVAGHTDNKPLGGGPFKDNWGLSLMRARSVLLFLVDPKDSALPVDHWSAAGFADTDPVAANDDNEGRQKNRRCDLIVVPSAEEMLDLNKITQ